MQLSAVLHYKQRKNPHNKNFKSYIFALYAITGDSLIYHQTTQYAQEVGESGIFTRLLVDALNGSAANLTGDVNPGSVYAYIDQSLGSWEQHPVFKTNVRSFTTLRKVQPPIILEDLQKLNVL